MRTRIREELIGMKNKLEELIKLLGTETGVTSIAEESLENIIFNPKLFNTPEKLAKLKETIGSFFSDSPTNDTPKIDARSKNQFFCLYAALWSRPDVLASTKISDFVRQMVLWFPQWTAHGKDLENIKRLKGALYDEQPNWKLENRLQKVPEWHQFMAKGGMSKSKTEHFKRLAVAIYTSVNQLVKELQS